jgi:serine/threonine-protein kinase
MHDMEVLIARTRVVQGSPRASDLRLSAHLDRLVRHLENECRRLHGHYIASRGQLVAKAVNLLVDKGSVDKNYDMLRDKLMARSGDFVTTVVRESAPETGKDGLATLTTDAVVNVKAVQRSLNEMSRSERIEFIRASGDPRVAVRVTTRDADAPNAPPRPSPAAENILKERIKSVGFRTWSENHPRGEPAAPAAAATPL